jgi:hypothetical protein
MHSLHPREFEGRDMRISPFAKSAKDGAPDSVHEGTPGFLMRSLHPREVDPTLFLGVAVNCGSGPLPHFLGPGPKTSVG